MSVSLRRHLRDWLFSIRTRLLLVNLLIAAVPLVGVGFARFYEREMLRGLEDDMIHQAEVLRLALLADPTGLRLGDRGPLLAAIAQQTRLRIRLLGPAGELLADSHAAGPPEGPERPPPSLWDLGERKQRPAEPRGARPPEPLDVSARAEVRRAVAGQYGATTRFWENRDTLYLFSALPIVERGEVRGVVYATRSTNPVRAALYRLRATLVQVLLGALAATAVLSLFLAATIARPLSRLTRLAERISRGDRRARLKLARRDEIGTLARSFDAMARNLDERARHVAELAANISHEFKSPLTGIRGAAELLREGAADDPEARQRFLGHILADAERLDRLVTRLLELARLEADPAPMERLDYEELAREAAERAKAGAPVAVSCEVAHAEVTGRRAQLASLLVNLIENAQQHARPGTAVAVRVTALPGGGLRTSVHNAGLPIGRANLARIWERFFTTRADQGGTGLGLPIVAAVARAHGATVAVVSTEDDGTTFTVDLPATA